MEADEQFYISLIEKHLSEDNILFDVGARKGEYSEYFLGKIKTKKAYLFDPNDYVLKDLNERFEGNANIILNQLAVDKENGTKDFYKVSLDSPMGGLSSLHFREDVFDKVIPETIEVQTIKLDDYCKENSIDEIDFLKIDTEGNELSCLLGAQELIKNKKIKFIQIEYGLTWIDSKITIKECIELLKPNGYKIYSHVKGKLKEITSTEDTYAIDTCINYLITYKEM